MDAKSLASVRNACMKYVVERGNLCAARDLNVGFSVGDWSFDKALAPNRFLSTGIFYFREGTVSEVVKLLMSVGKLLMQYL